MKGKKQANSEKNWFISFCCAFEILAVFERNEFHWIHFNELHQIEQKKKKKKIHNFFKAFLLVLIISFAFIFCCWWFFFSFHSWITKTANCIIDGLAKWKEEGKKHQRQKKTFHLMVVENGCSIMQHAFISCIHSLVACTMNTKHDLTQWNSLIVQNESEKKTTTNTWTGYNPCLLYSSSLGYRIDALYIQCDCRFESRIQNTFVWIAFAKHWKVKNCDQTREKKTHSLIQNAR